MDNFERRSIRSCWWFKRTTKRIDRALGDCYAWAKDGDIGEPPPKEARPEYMLDPGLNGTNGRLDEFGACMRHYRPGELPAMVALAFSRMVDVASGFVVEFEETVRFKSLNDSLSIELEFYRYMTTTPISPVTRREHCAKVNAFIEGLKASFRENARASYDWFTELVRARGAAGRRTEGAARMGRMERKIDSILTIQTMDEVAGGHCWDAVSSGRRRQLLRLREWMADPGNRKGEFYSLSYGCTQAFFAVEGGYPNSRAMYSFAHRHAVEFG